MRIRPNLLAAGVGLTVLLAVGVPAVAYAEGGSAPSTTTSAAAPASCPGQTARKAVATYLAAHPDVAGLLDQLRTAAAGQRRQVAADYLKAHPQSRGELRDALKQLRQHARSCRAGGN